MVDKIVELLQDLKDDVGELRKEMHYLSDKIDNLSQKSNINKDITQDVQDDVSQNVNYGRKLSQSEQEYLKELNNQVTATDKIIELNTQGELPEDAFVEDIPVAPMPSDININETQDVQQVQVYEKNVVEKFFIWLAKDWPMKVGGFFVISAIGWFVTYAASVGWLSEVARVVLGYIVAINAVIFGATRVDKEKTQGNLFLIIGIAAMLISTLAGIYYDIVVHIVGMFVMLISVGFVTLISLKQKSMTLTSSMIFFGAIIPLFFVTGVNSSTVFLYLFILTLGTLWVVTLTSWRGLTTMMLVIVGFYSIVYIADFAHIESIYNIVLSFVFAGVFYVANVSSIIKSKKTSSFDIITALGIGTLMLIWILSFAGSEIEVFLLLIAVLFFALASYIIFTKTGRKAPTVIYGGVTATLFAVATALQFDGAVLTTVYLLEASAITIITLYFARASVNSMMRVILILLCVVPLFMSLGAVVEIFDYLDYSSIGDVLSLMPELFTVFIASITMFAIAITILKVTNMEETGNITFFRIFAYIGGVFGLLLVWFMTHLFMNNSDVATFTALVTYTITGVAFYVMGVKDGYKPYRVVGGILFGVVVLRVLFVEFWDMDIVMRFVTSFVLGALLISTAFIKRNKH